MPRDKPKQSAVPKAHRGRKAFTHARGGFFAAVETKAYLPRGHLIGQFRAESCVPACCRMLLCDQAEDVAESYLRAAFATNRHGSTMKLVPDILRQFGLPTPYVYRAELSLIELRAAVARGTAIVFVRAAAEDGYHALLVDDFADELVLIRDPLPEGSGAAYQVSLATFLSCWIQTEHDAGSAVIVVE